ncbi:M16 family metallopeptidase [Dinoroseobacter sp. S375]|uniref:M16 family metallopeptidase n=1 Tax=Dinoroseobacter sp. S375 TaxID=3415136 RepID=UPI003C7BD7FC
MSRLLGGFAALILWAVPAWAIVDIQEVTSPGGIKAWLVEDHSIPFTALEIRFKGGAVVDPADKRGAAHFMSGLLEEGAGDYDARAYAARTEALAASFDFDISDDSLSVSARFLTENRDEALEHLRLALQEPRFDESAIERVRAQIQSIIASDAKDPETIVGERFDSLAFPDHPYGTAREGSIESVAAITRADLVAAHQGILARDRIYVGAAGDVTAEELGTLLDALLGALPETGAPLPGETEVALSGGVTVVPFASPQSVARFGHTGLERDDPDFFPAFILNQIVGGGGFSSRLMQEVRVERGLTYGIGSYLLPLDDAALYIGQFSSDNTRIAEAIEVIRGQWADIAENGVTAEELEQAKIYLTGAYPLRFDGNGRIASILVGMQQDDLGIDYIPTRNDKVRAVTLEEIQRVAARLMRPEDLHFVVVGMPEGLEASN